MSPRERVTAALAHKEPDRVPTDFWAVPELWQRMQRYFGGVPREEVLQRLNVDVRWVVPEYVGPSRRTPHGIQANEYGSWRQTVVHAFGSYEEYAGYPLAEARSPADVAQWDWPRTEYWDMAGLDEKLDDLASQGDYFVCYNVGGILERSWDLRGQERILMDLILNPEVACAIMDRMTDLYIANVTRLLELYEGRVHMVYTWDDLGHQHGPMISLDMWRRYILPRHQRLNEAIRKFEVKIMYHSCGAIFPFIDALEREMGIDVLNPLQPRAAGMDLQQIKKQFGARLSFHGSVDIQHTMPYGETADVRAEVRERCRVLGKGGGFILAPAHSLQNDTPIENVLAMYRTPRDVALGACPSQAQLC